MQTFDGYIPFDHIDDDAASTIVVCTHTMTLCQSFDIAFWNSLAPFLFQASIIN